jgi:predicted GNAT family acetyltransferase
VGLWVTEGEVVSMCGYSPPVANSVRIGPVYTPSELRGNGYATALVATQSGHHLAKGRDRCLLYTDLANPTSNAIYKRIGYRQVAESVVHRFRPDPN